MGRNYKFQPKNLAATASAFEPGCVPVAAQRIQSNTANNYMSLIRQLEAFEAELTKVPGPWFRRHMGADMFCAFINAHALHNGGQFSSAGQFLNAAKHAQRTRGWRDHHRTRWAEDIRCKRAVEGAMYNAGVDLRESIRGALSEDLFQELIQKIPFLERRETKHAIFRRCRKFQDALAVGFGAALRIHELQYLRVKNWNKHTQYLTINGNKSDRRGSRKGQTYDKLIVLPETVAVLNRITKNRHRNDFIFPRLRSKKGFWMSDLGRFIKQAAVTLGWTERYGGLFFDGVHVLRHGGSQAIDAYCRRHRLSSRQRRAALCMSTDNEKRYLRSNEDRQKLIEAAADTRRRELGVSRQDPMQQVFAKAIARVAEVRKDAREPPVILDTEQRRTLNALRARDATNQNNHWSRPAKDDMPDNIPEVPVRVVPARIEIQSSAGSSSSRCHPPKKKRRVTVADRAAYLMAKMKQ